VRLRPPTQLFFGEDLIMQGTPDRPHAPPGFPTHLCPAAGPLDRGATDERGAGRPPVASGSGEENDVWEFLWIDLGGEG
jgi:hypothetical protein